MSKQKSYIRSSEKIRQALLSRFELLELKQADILRDAEERGMKISKSMLSRYIKNVDGVQITEEQIIWLCLRYDLPVVVEVGVPELKNGLLHFKIPKKYNESRALRILQKVFPA